MRSQKLPTHGLIVLLVAVTLAAGGVLASCSSSGGDNAGDATVDSDGVADTSGSTSTGTQQGQNTQQQQGAGKATLKVGDKTYEFDTVMCAFGTDETKNADWDFSLSAIQDGTQLSVSRGAEGGQYGDSVSLDDIENVDDPSVSWSAPAHVLPTAANPNAVVDDSFVEIDNKNISAQAQFDDGTKGTTGEPVAGTLTATCP